MLDFLLELPDTYVPISVHKRVKQLISSVFKDLFLLLPKTVVKARK